MPTLRVTSLLLRLNLHSTSGWWSRRPWADALTYFDTSAFVPGPNNAAPLLDAAKPRRTARRPERHAYWQPRTARPLADRRWLDSYGSLHVPAAAKLVADDEAARLEQARRRIGFTPTKGFLHATVLGRLPRED